MLKICLSKYVLVVVVLLLLFVPNGWSADLTGTIVDFEGNTYTGKEVYVFVYAITVDGDNTTVDNATYVGSTQSDSGNGTWTVTGLDAATYYMVLFMHGNPELAGAEFLTTL